MSLVHKTTKFGLLTKQEMARDEFRNRWPQNSPYYARILTMDRRHRISTVRKTVVVVPGDNYDVIMAQYLPPGQSADKCWLQVLHVLAPHQVR